MCHYLVTVVFRHDKLAEEQVKLKSRGGGERRKIDATAVLSSEGMMNNVLNVCTSTSSLPTQQIWQLGRWSNYDAVVTPIASFLEAPL